MRTPYGAGGTRGLGMEFLVPGDVCLGEHMRHLAFRLRGSAYARALVVIVGVAPALVAQRPGVITGTVKDESGARVPNVEVTVTKTGAVAHTDSLGRFFLARL